MNSRESTAVLSKAQSWQIFDDISNRYDFLNHLFSFGLDVQWRRQLAKHITPKGGQKVLDLATGTADVLLALFRQNPHIHSGFGIDLSDKMMAIGRHKIAQHGLSRYITLSQGDVNQAPFQNNLFDVVTIAFGIRNTEDPQRVLREMYRVLKTGGRALILEFSLPQNNIVRPICLFYLRHILPVIGGMFTGQFQAYRYLNQTIENFPYGNAFCGLMHNAGFENVKAHPLFFGAASIYQGDKI
ncbi:MAG: bifunctional demethylmenaquinone methyltransferase/2-methoxy-6-polyprenyl-1,4-benzoquinol methylase UbiE [Candidatus Omnitrophica bacterium]|nr:bifunctional demethylmenaquinone methyltransferase/2-methoxy-6-polyprenyl-1,4-benzoquinol methylase UbiE [Candidatus Omnitrophota bacterium]